MWDHVMGGVTSRFDCWLGFPPPIGLGDGFPTVDEGVSHRDLTTRRAEALGPFYVHLFFSINMWFRRPPIYCHLLIPRANCCSWPLGFCGDNSSPIVRNLLLGLVKEHQGMKRHILCNINVSIPERNSTQSISPGAVLNHLSSRLRIGHSRVITSHGMRASANHSEF